MARSKRSSSERQATDWETRTLRPWAASVAWSITAIVLVLTIAVVVNLAIGRVIHWEIVGVSAALGFVFLSIGRRYRTI